MTNAVNINSSWPPSGRLRIVVAQVPKMAKSFVNIEELLGQLEIIYARNDLIVSHTAAREHTRTCLNLYI